MAAPTPLPTYPTVDQVNTLLAATAIEGNSSGHRRFPLQIPCRNRIFCLAPIDPYNLESYNSYYRAKNVDELGQLYIVSTHRTPSINDLPQGELVGSNTYLRRRHNSIYCSVFWQDFPKNDTVTIKPAETINKEKQVPLQPWLPPYTMPAHPVFAFYGRDLSNTDLQLPALRPWGVGIEQKMFTRVEDRQTKAKKDGEAKKDRNDWTDAGFGPGVKVHENLEEGVRLATEYHQMQWMMHDKQTRERAALQGQLGRSRAEDEILKNFNR